LLWGDPVRNNQASGNQLCSKGNRPGEPVHPSYYRKLTRP
jgi:hypothetical protein